MIFSLPRGCMIFLSQEVAGFFCPKSLRDFFLSKEVVRFFLEPFRVICSYLCYFFCSARLCDFFVLRVINFCLS